MNEVTHEFDTDDGSFDQDLARIVTALGVQPASDAARKATVLLLTNSQGVGYSFADIIEALVARVAVFTDLLEGPRLYTGPPEALVGDDLSQPPNT